MTLEQFQTWLRSFDGDTGLVIQIFVVVFSVLLFSFFVRILLNRLHRRLSRTENPWDDALVDAARPAVSVLIWLLGLSFAAQIVAQETDATIFDAIEPVRDVGVIATITWFLIRLVRRIEHNFVKRRTADSAPVDHTTVDAIAKLVRVSILITAALVILQTLGFSISGVLAFGGIGGIAVGFAAKDLLANFFGGLMVYLDRPFSVGDWIRSPDRNIEGTVEEIGWRLTRIRTFDKRPLYVPNSTFTSIAVENPSRMHNRRIFETIGVRYDDVARLPAIVSDVRALLQRHEDIDQSQLVMVNFNAFAASSLDFFVYCFTRTTQWAQYHEVKQDVLFKISEIIARHGAEVAFPTSTVHLPDGVHIQSGAELQESASS